MARSADPGSGGEAGASSERLYRCMRYAVGINFFRTVPGARGEPLRFANNRLSATLREHHVQSQKYLVRASSSTLTALFLLLSADLSRQESFF